MSKTILITGASAGISETARLAAQRGDAVFMIAVDAVRLQAAAASLGGPTPAEIETVDLTDAAALDALLAKLDARGYVPDVLVNNAGLGLSGAFAEADGSRLDAMLRLNVNALARLTHWAARRMKARRSGAIVNLSAAVATRPVPYFAAYAASKAFVNNLSQALHYELRPFGVSVSAVHPPAVRTGFAAADKADLGSTLVLKLFPTVGPDDGRAGHSKRCTAEATLGDHRPGRGRGDGDCAGHAARSRPAVHEPAVPRPARRLKPSRQRRFDMPDPKEIVRSFYAKLNLATRRAHSA